MPIPENEDIVKDLMYRLSTVSALDLRKKGKKGFPVSVGSDEKGKTGVMFHNGRFDFVSLYNCDKEIIRNEIERKSKLSIKISSVISDLKRASVENNSIYVC